MMRSSDENTKGNYKLASKSSTTAAAGKKNTNNTNSKSDRHSDSDFLNYIKRFDIYTKLEEDYKVQTSGGGGIAILGWLIMTLLIIGE